MILYLYNECVQVESSKIDGAETEKASQKKVTILMPDGLAEICFFLKRKNQDGKQRTINYSER